jgi:hypothetical protein
MHAVALGNRSQRFAGSTALDRFGSLVVAQLTLAAEFDAGGRPLDVSASVFLLLFDSFGDGMEVHLTE